MNKEEEKEKTKAFLRKEYEKGNVVVNTIEGPVIYKLTELVNQPSEGLLYDLNRDILTIFAFIDDPKWINDYASSMVICHLKSRIEELENLINK